MRRDIVLEETQPCCSFRAGYDFVTVLAGTRLQPLRSRPAGAPLRSQVPPDPESNSNEPHSNVRDRSPEIETIYRAYQVLLLICGPRTTAILAAHSEAPPAWQTWRRPPEHSASLHSPEW